MKRNYVFLLALTGLLLFGTVGATSLDHTSDEQVNVLILYESHEAKADSAVDEVGGTVTGEVDIIPAEFARIHKDDMDAIERKPGVKYVERDHRGRVMGQTKSWGIKRINGTEAERSVNDTAESKVDVAVIDSGIDYDHEDLSNNVVWGVNTQGTTTTDGVTAADDDYGHGTHVAGIIAAENNSVGVLGVAPKSDLYSIKITDSRGNGFYSDFIEGLDRAVKGPDDTVGTGDDADVISMSYGSPIDSRVVESAVEEASKESVLVAAAINSGDGDASTNEVGYPAVYEETITVAATNRSDETARFSSEGEEVDVAAPGVEINSTTPCHTISSLFCFATNSSGSKYGTSSGTSMATPHVSGTVAHIIAKDMEDGSRDLTNEQIRNRLQRTAIDIESPGVDAFSGYGRIQANRSLTPQISAEFTFSPSNPDAGESVTFDASNSNNPNGSISSYDWNFGDGSTMATTFDTVSHTYSENGTFSVTLTVNGDGGSTDTVEREITVGDPNPGPDWVKFRNDTRNTGHHPGAKGPKRNVVEKWSFSTSGSVESSPAVVDGAVYVGSDDNNVYALKESNGDEIWSASTGGDIRSSPWAANRAIAVGSNDDETHTFDDETGGEFTEGLGTALRTNDDVFSSPTIDTTRAIAYLGSQDGTVYAFGAAGIPPNRVWTFPTGGPINSSAALANGNVYIGSGDANVYALDSLTGSEQWNTTTGGPVISSPAVVNGSVYVGSADGSVYSLSASTGSEQWNTTTGGPVISSPAVADGVVYVGSNDNSVYALDASNGNVLWNFPTGGSVLSSPAVVDNTVYVGSNDNKVYALNASTASMSDEERERWNYTTGGDVVSSPAVVKNTVYVGSSDGNVYALTSDTATQIDSCTDITSSGEYALNTSITNSGASSCVNITASDVIFDGRGHTVDGTNGSGTVGINVTGSTTLTNVTVRDVTVTDWDEGIRYDNVEGGKIAENRVTSNTNGIHLLGSFTSNNEVSANNASANSQDGILVEGGRNSVVSNTVNANGHTGIEVSVSDNNTVRNNTASRNGLDGILLDTSSDNTLTNNTARNNTDWDFFSRFDSTNNTVRNLDIGASTNPDTTVTFEESTDIGLKATDSPPSDPSGKENIDRYVNITNSSADSFVFLNMSYTDSDASGVDESSLRMWENNGSWSEVPGVNGVDTAENEVFANVTNFSVFAPLGNSSDGDGTPVSSCTDITSPGLYTLNTSISNSGASPCISITSSDVIFDGNGHFIDGDGSGIGIHVNGPLSNVTVRDVETTDWGRGIWLEDASRVEVLNISSKKNSDAVRLSSSDNNSISGSNIFSSGAGIRLVKSSSGNRITSNTIKNHSDGVNVRSSNQNTIKNNVISNNSGVGVRLWDSSEKGEVTGNTLDSNGIGILFQEPPSGRTADNRIVDNRVFNSSFGSGIALIDSYNSTVQNNTAESNDGAGIFLRNSSDIKIEENTAESNGINGILLNSSSENAVRRNIAKSNKLAGIGTGTNSKTNRNVIENNTASFNDWIGIGWVGSNNTIENNTAHNNSVYGIGLGVLPSNNNELIRNDIQFNDVGIGLNASSEDNVGIDNIIENNTEAIVTEEGAEVLNQSSDDGTSTTTTTTTATTVSTLGTGVGTLSQEKKNAIRNNSAKNSDVAFRTSNGAATAIANLDIGESTKPETLVSLEGENVSVRAVSNPPSNPNATAIGRYLNATEETNDSFLDMGIRYTESDVEGVNESSLSIWKHNGTEWREINSSVNTTQNVVNTSVTEFSTFGIFTTDTGATEVSSCRDITSPGLYTLNTSIINSTAPSCINVTSSDVIFDGQGHTVDGVDDSGTIGVNVTGTSTLTNVTVRNVTITDWNNGIEYNEVDDGNITNNNATSNGDGIFLTIGSSNNTVTNNKASENSGDGILLFDSSNNNTVTNNTASENTGSGIVLGGGSGNNVTGNNASANDGEFDSSGIRLVGGNNNTVMDNIAIGNENGILLDSSSSNNTVMNNKASENIGNGIRLDSSSGNNVTGNNASANEDFSDGIRVFSSDGNTVKDNKASENSGAGIGLSRSSSNNIMYNNASGNDGDGIQLSRSSGNNVTANNVTSNLDDGVQLSFSTSGDNVTGNNAILNSDNGLVFFDTSNHTVINNNASGNDGDGIVLKRSSDNNTVTNNTARNNGDWDFRSIENSTDNTVRNLDIGMSTNPDTTLTFNKSKDVALKSVNNPPADPSGKQNISRYVEATNTSADSFVFLNVSYNDSDVSNVDESSLRMWKNDGSWSEVPGTNGVDTAENVAFANITEFSTFAPLATPAFFDVNITGTNSPVVEGEKLTVDVNVTNTGATSDTQEINLTDFDGVEQDSVNVTLGSGESNSSITINWTTTEGDNGTGDVTVFSENDSDTQSVTINERAFFDVNVTGTNSPVTEGDTLSVDVNVTNTGDETATQTLNLTDTGFNNNEQDTVDVTLNGGESNNSITLDWSTSEGDNGTGDVTVFSENDSDTETVTVNERAFFDVNVTGTNSPVTEGDTLSVNVNVTNTGDETATQTLNLTDTDFNNNEQDTVDVTLNGGESNSSITLNWTTAEGDNGTGDVTVFSENDSDTETVTVNEPAFFDVNLTGTNSPVTEGDTLTVDVNVTNTGDETATQTLNLTDTDFNNAEQDTVDVTLNGGESNNSITLDWSTSESDSGTGDVTVFSENDSDTETVTVNEPAFFDVNITGTNSPVTEGDTLTVDVNVTNTGDETATQTLNLTDTGFSNNEQDTVDVTLNGGEFNNSITLDWSTSEGDNGTGDVTVFSENDSDVETVTVNETAFFDVNITGTNSPVTEGDTLSVDVNVTNTGDETATQILNLTDTDFNNAEQDTVDVTLNGGEFNNSITLDWTTTEGDNGTGDVTVFSENDSDAQSVTINETAFFDVNITGTNSPVTEGDTLTVDVNVTNTGDETDTQTLNLTDTGFNNAEQDTVSVTLAGGEFNNSITLDWTTAEGDNGTGDVTVFSENDSDAETVTVNEPAFFDVNITGTNSPVTEGDTLSVDVNVTNTGDETATQTLNLTDTDFDNNEQDTIDVTLNGGESNSSITLDWTTTEGDNGTGDVTVFSENDSATETVTVNEREFFDVNITGTNSPVTEGDTLSVDVNVTNTGDETATQTLNLTDTGFNNNEQDTVDVTLNGGESNSSITLDWGTSEGDNGTGDVTVFSENDSDSETVTVNEPAFFDVNITGTNSPVTEGDTLNVDVNVTNTGDETATQTLNLTDTGFNNNEQDTVDVTLNGGESNNSITLDWSTSEGDSGTGDVTVFSENDSDTQSVTVNEPAFFDVNVTGTNSPVTEGDTLTVDVNVTNTGDETATQTLNLTDTGFNNNEQDTVSVTLAGGESNNSITLDWNTAKGDNGTGDVTVFSENDSDTQSVTVNEPAFFDVNITGTNSPVTEGDILSVDVNVTNTGDETATQTLNLTDTGFNNNEQDTVDVTLNGGESNSSITLNWTTAEGDNGTGDVTVFSENDTDAETVTVNDVPTVVTNTGSTVDEGAIDTITQSELETTDAEQGPASLTYTIDADVSEGQLFNTDTNTQLDQNDTFTQQDINDGFIEYQHDGTEPTSESFNFTVRDGAGGSTSDTFSITINQVNDPPTANDDDITPSPPPTEDDDLTLSSAYGGIDVVGNDDSRSGVNNDTDVDDPISALSIRSITTGQGTETAENTPLTLVDTTQGFNNQEIRFDVSFSGQEVTVAEQSNLDALPSGTTGTFSFEYTVQDDDGDTGNESTATVTFEVAGVNDAPLANSDSDSTTEDSLVGGSVSEDLGANDVDPDDPINVASTDTSDSATTNSGTTVTLVRDSLSGNTLTVAPDPTNTVTLDDGSTVNALNALADGESATFTFGYTIEDDDGATDTSTYEVTVTGNNDVPVTQNQTYSKVEDSSTMTKDVVALAADDVDDSDINLDVSTIDGGSTSTDTVTASSGATVSLTASIGSDPDIIEFTPTNMDALDTDDGTVSFTFDYRIEDDDGDVSSQKQITVDVTGENDAPTANDDSASTSQDTSVTVDVVANDADVDDDLSQLNVTEITDGPSHGTAQITGTSNDKIEFTPGSGETSDVQITYEVSDDNGATDTATLSVTVNAVNTAPTANDDSDDTNEGQSTTTDVLANDTDPDGSLNASTVTVQSGPSDGSVGVDDTTGEITYTPDSGFTGTDSYTYTVKDDDGAESNEATVTIVVNKTGYLDVNVTGTNSPVTEGNTLTVDVNVTNTGDETATQTLNLTDTDFNNNEQDTVSVTLAGGESNNSITLDWSTSEGDNGTGDVTVFSENDSDTQSVTVNEPAFFDVNVIGTNSPVTEGDTLTVDVNVTNTGDETATQTLNLTDTDFNNNEQDMVDVTLNGGESNSSITLDWNTVEGDNGTGDVTVFSENDTGTISVTVNESNTPPTVDFTFTPDNPSTVDTVEFNASSSDDPDGSITNYTWNFGDGETGTGETVTHSYDNASTFTATLNVVDDDGATANTTQVVMVEEGCVNRRNLGRGETGKECPRDRELGRGESRGELDRETGRNSDTARRDRGRSNRGRSR